MAVIPVVIDLAAPQTPLKVDAGTYRVTLMNTVIGREYWLHIGPSLAMQLPPLSAEGPKTAAEIRSVSVDKCRLLEPTHAVIDATSEKDVRDRVDRLRIAVAKADPIACREQVKYATDTIAATRVTFDNSPVSLGSESSRHLKIASRAGDRWSVEVNSMGRGTWQTSYGFAFSPNNDQEFFSEPTGESEFRIRRKPKDAGSLTYLPAIYFTWLPAGQAHAAVQHGPTVGLGVTTGDTGGRFAVLAGWTVRFHQNIGVVAGVNIYGHRRLDGQYREDQPIRENLDTDTLNRDSTRANLFVAFALRLGASPF